MYPMPNNPYNNFPNYSQPRFNPYPQPVQPQFIAQPVGSIDEAKGFPVDPNIGYLFPDTGNGRIYFKQLNLNTGKSEIVTYAPVEEQAPEDFNTVLSRRLDAIEKTLGGLNESLSSLSKYDKSNEKPDGGNATKNAR